MTEAPIKLFCRRCAQLLLLAALASDFSHALQPDAARVAPPNILLIMLDDAGYNDLAVNGNAAAPTPQLDEFARQGIRYTRHYADSSCSPARVATLTGRAPANFGFRPVHLGLSPGTPTIASMLRDAGYSTAHIGKWHVGVPTLAQSPTQVGFDHWFGFMMPEELSGPAPDIYSYGEPSYHDPWLREDDAPPQQYKGHLTDILTARATAFIRAQQGASTPWFLNLWYLAPHEPIEPATRYAEQWPDTPEGNYYALLQQLDSGIGEVLQALEDSGQNANTLVVIVSDNGGTNKRADNNAPFFGRKTQFLEGSYRTPLLLRWPGNIPAGAVSDEVVSLVDLLPTIASASGGDVPPDAEGRDLLQEPPLPARTLFWESSNGSLYGNSILSADGRWRYSNRWTTPFLSDLEQDSSGSTNAIAEHPEVALQLHKAYLRWRQRARIVEPDYQIIDARGAATLTGQDVLRSPGYSGFTLALAVTPAAETGPGTTVIAEQAGRLRITYDPVAGISASVLGTELRAPEVAPGTCHDVVLTTYFKLSPRHRGRASNWADLVLFVDGKLIDRAHHKQPVQQVDGLEQPTFVGVNPRGGEAFAGYLGRPLILNERVVPDMQAQDGFGNGISDVPSPCATAHAAASTAAR